jgi:hypothetical protein
MIEFTAPDGSKVSVDGKRVVRARRTLDGERGNENADAQSRIDWVEMQLVKEPIDAVSARIKAELPEFTALTTKDRSRIWFNAKKVVGPLRITDQQRNNGYRSSIKLMGYRQYVIETPDQVREILAAAGGDPL